MGKRKKKGKKGNQPAAGDLHRLTADQLLERGVGFLERGKPRDAINVLSFTAKKHGHSKPVDGALFRAYLQRESQLRSKNLMAEADAVRMNARALMPRLTEIDPADLTAYIKNCANKEAFGIYAKYLAHRDRCPEADRFLANRLLLHRCWDHLERFPEGHPLAREAGPAKEAVALMDAGRWEEARDRLRPVSRNSPYAPLRIFGRAMAAFYQEDDADAARALALVPDDFILAGTARNLRTVLAAAASGEDPGETERKEALARTAAVWDGPVDLEKDLLGLLLDLKEARYGRAVSAIRKAADQLSPEAPEPVVRYILEILWQMVFHERIGTPDYQKLVLKLLPPETGDLVIAKVNLAYGQPLITAGVRYLSLLDREFPDPRERKMAAAMVLNYMVAEDLSEGGRSRSLNFGLVSNREKKMMGITAEDRDLALIQMMGESIRLDPGNRRTYEILVRLPRTSRPCKQQVEHLLLTMKKTFPDDPFPCLSLAELYYSSNAFRKAENILEEAAARAPHDSQVIDRRGLALLISAQKNIDRGKFHLADADIDRAAEVGSKRLTPLIVEKRMLLGATAGGISVETLMDKGMEEQDLFHRLRILGIFRLDVASRRPAPGEAPVKKIDARIRRELKQLPRLSSQEVARLLLPVERDFGAVLGARDVGRVFLDLRKDVLRRMTDEDALLVYEHLLDPRFHDRIRKDAKKRIRTARTDHRLFFEFHLALMDEAAGKGHNSEKFERIKAEAAGRAQEQLRGLSRRIAPHFEGPLRTALEQFDFRMLDGPFLPGLFDPDFLDDLDDDFDPASDLDLEGNPMALLGEVFQEVADKIDILLGNRNMPWAKSALEELTEEIGEVLEEFIEDAGLRGMPDFLIREMGGLLRSEVVGHRRFDKVVRIFRELEIDDRLSREARLLIFREDRGAGRRRREC